LVRDTLQVHHFSCSNPAYSITQHRPRHKRPQDGRPYRHVGCVVDRWEEELAERVFVSKCVKSGTLV